LVVQAYRAGGGAYGCGYGGGGCSVGAGGGGGCGNGQQGRMAQGAPSAVVGAMLLPKAPPLYVGHMGVTPMKWGHKKGERGKDTKKRKEKECKTCRLPENGGPDSTAAARCPGRSAGGACRHYGGMQATTTTTTTATATASSITTAAGCEAEETVPGVAVMEEGSKTATINNTGTGGSGDVGGGVIVGGMVFSNAPPLVGGRMIPQGTGSRGKDTKKRKQRTCKTCRLPGNGGPDSTTAATCPGRSGGGTCKHYVALAACDLLLALKS
jgi:hypothetical protein